MPLCVSRMAYAQNGGRLYFCKHGGKRDRRGRLFEHVLQEHIPREGAPFYCVLCGYKAMDAWSLASHVDRYAPHRAAVQRTGAVDNASIMRIGTFTPGDFEKHVGTVVEASATELPGWLTQMIDADVGVPATIAPADPVQMAWDAACAGSAEKYDGPAFIVTRCEAVTPPPAPSTPVQDESVMPTETDQADTLFQGQEAENSVAGELRSIRELLGQAVGLLASIADRSAQLLDETRRIERSLRSMNREMREARKPARKH